MANYGDKYRIDFNNIDGVRFRVMISQKEYTGAVYVLQGAASPFIINYRDTSESIYAPIKASEAVIRIVSQNGFDVLTVISEDDTEFKVTLSSINGVEPTELLQDLWVGFIDGFASQEELLDDPRVIQLKATDGIGLLKNQEFRDEAGDILYDKYDLIDIIYQCIYKTGVHDLPLNVQVNVFAEGMLDPDQDPANDPFAQTVVHTRSFVKKPQEYENCYNILEAIMKAFNATLFQADGYWHIIRFPERWQSDTLRSVRYLWPYAEASDMVQWQYRHNVNQIDVTAINADHIRSFVPAAKSGIVTYDYDYSPEYYRNINFREGAFKAFRTWYIVNPDLTQPETYARAYEVDHWNYRFAETGEPDLSGTPPALGSVVLERLDVVNAINQTSRDEFMIMFYSGSSDVGALTTDDWVEVAAEDTVSFSFDTKDVTQSPVFVDSMNEDTAAAAYVILSTNLGELDDVRYYLSKEGKWSESTGGAILIDFGGDGPDSTRWQSVSVTSEPVPFAGKVFVSLKPWAFQGERSTCFKNVSVSFSNSLSGQRGTVSQQIVIKEKFERDVKMGDPASPVVNGAFFQTVPNDLLWETWSQWGSTEEKYLAQILARDLFRARKRLKTKVEGTIKGIITEMPQDTDLVGLISPNWHIQYGALSGYVYLPSSLELNIEADTAKVYLYEFYHSTFDNANEEGDDQEFKYLK
jgi:hypothetical protein